MMNTNTEHYCEDHNSKFYRNEKQDSNGLLSIWYSHKKADGSGFCVEKNSQSKGQKGGTAVQTKLFDGVISGSALSSQTRGMYVCNAMNNAVNLASNGVIGVDQIGQYFKKIYSELNQLSL